MCALLVHYVSTSGGVYVVVHGIHHIPLDVVEGRYWSQGHGYPPRRGPPGGVPGGVPGGGQGTRKGSPIPPSEGILRRSHGPNAGQDFLDSSSTVPIYV